MAEKNNFIGKAVFSLAGLLMLGLFFVAGQARAETAVYDPTYQTPLCLSGIGPCQVPASLVQSRDSIGGTSEPNQPNTLATDTCPDGASGTYLNSESLDGFTVISNSPWLIAGDTATVQASVYCDATNWASDRLNVYTADSAAAPSWNFQGSAYCTMPGSDTLSMDFPLPAAGTAAVRMQFQRGGTATSCDASAYTDHDDLVLLVNADTDGDGVTDSAETAAGSDPNDPLIAPGWAAEPGFSLNDPGYQFGAPATVWNGSEFRVFFSATDLSFYDNYIAWWRPTQGYWYWGISLYEQYGDNPSTAWNGANYGTAFSSFSSTQFAFMNASGSQVGSTIGISEIASNVGHARNVHGQGNFGVAYQSNFPGNNEIYFTSVTDAGTWLGFDTRLSNDPASSSEPELAWTGSEYAVVWTDGRDANTEIYFTRVTPGGTAIGGEIRLTSDPGYSNSPRIVSTGSELGVSWTDSRSGNNQAYFVRLTYEGTKIGGDSRISFGAAYSYSSFLTWTGSEYWAAHRDNVPGGQVISFTRLSPAGAPLDRDKLVTDPGIHPFSVSIAFGDTFAGSAGMDGSTIHFNQIRSDSDGDQATDHQEASFFTNPANWDTDGDMMSDGWEILHNGCVDPLIGDSAADPDGDLETNLEEYQYRGDPCTFNDRDYDGMPDKWEDLHSSCGLDSSNYADGVTDADGDGLTNLAEYNNNTDPCNPDSDGDGLTDGDEVNLYATDPLNPDSDGDGLSDFFEVTVTLTDPQVADSDADGLSDYDEVLGWGTDPNSADSDGDGVSDSLETAGGTNPWLADSDSDGLSDWTEINVTGTDPTNNDTNSNGVPDGLEPSLAGTDADHDGIPNAWEDLFACVSASAGDSTADPDGDGLSNIEEYNLGTDPCLVDTDGDGLTDGNEVNVAGTDPASADTDGDGLTDGEEVNTYSTDPLDPDSDNDGYSDGAEIAAGTLPNDPLSHPTAASHLVNYQGRLMDDAGFVVEGTQSMTFRIFDVLAGGTALWSETQSVQVTGGIYNVLLGSQTELDPSIFGTSELYLEVETNGEALSPRQRITSVPFAIQSERAFGGRQEIDTRPINIPAGASSVTVQVSFKQAFNSPPQVIVSFGDIYGIGNVSNVTASGFELSFIPTQGGTGGTFTYMAFGN